jgi:hypothetical protein
MLYLTLLLAYLILRLVKFTIKLVQVRPEQVPEQWLNQSDSSQENACRECHYSA